MDNRIMLTVCRICLEDGATVPIFDKKETVQDNIISKISLCLNVKIENMEGYPTHICKVCDDMLDTLVSFINKFKQSTKVLEENGLVRNVDKNYNYFKDNNASDTEIDIKIKIEAEDYQDEVNDEADEDFAKLLKPLKIKLPDIKIEKVSKIELKSKKKHVRSKKKLQNRPSKIVSSLLEGEFSWSGDRWCLKTNQTVAKVKEKALPLKRERQIMFNVPKLSAANESTLCDICGEVFKSREKLCTHKRNIHFRKPVQCPKCTRVCASMSYLQKHMKRKHETEKNFICTVCGKGFAFKGELSSHSKNVHEKDRKPKKTFACKFCDKTYKCPKSIVVHERSVHTGLRPAVCSVCGSSFFHIDYLKAHMRLHTGETPFKCPVCGRGYAQLCNMKSHLRIHKISELDANTLSKMRPNYLKLLKA